MDKAVEGVLRTFKLPKFQRSSLKRLLQKRWRWPLTREEALHIGQLQEGDRACLRDPYEIVPDRDPLEAQRLVVKINGR